MDEDAIAALTCVDHACPDCLPRVAASLSARFGGLNPPGTYGDS
jgi:hypothetical protein